jgi:exodeoxyribonuclease V alpha subunit
VPLAAEGHVEDPGGDLAALLEHHGRARILCVTRIPAGGAGTTAVNAYLEDRLGALLDQPPGRFAPGTPVLVTANDPLHGLFNGDTGVIVQTRAHDGALHPAALFSGPSGLRALHLGALATHLEPAFAMTVHKAQGSEYDEVLVLLPALRVRLLSREILYTAITRARRAVAIAGDEATLLAACEHRASRSTALPDLL